VLYFFVGHLGSVPVNVVPLIFTKILSSVFLQQTLKFLSHYFSTIFPGVTPGSVFHQCQIHNLKQYDIRLPYYRRILGVCVCCNYLITDNRGPSILTLNDPFLHCCHEGLLPVQLVKCLRHAFDNNSSISHLQVIGQSRFLLLMPWPFSHRESYVYDGRTAAPHFIYLDNKCTYWVFYDMLCNLRLVLQKTPYISQRYYLVHKTLISYTKKRRTKTEMRWPLMVTQWLRYCATNRKVAGSISDGVIGFFHWHNSSDRTKALRSTQPLTEMSTRSISWGVKAAGA
jgi:hypothetical protein